MIRCGDITGFDDAEVADEREELENETDITRQVLQHSEMGADGCGCSDNSIDSGLGRVIRL